MREMKFRCYHKEAKQMLANSEQEYEGKVFQWLYEGQNIEIMQFTGLLDKNGKEIYEGDILKRKRLTLGSFYNLQVYYSNEAAAFMLAEDANYDGWTLESDKSVDLIVIGNIYENPDLLN